MDQRAAHVAELAAENLRLEAARLQAELDRMTRRAELLEEAVVAASRGDLAPVERFAVMAGLGQPIVSSRAQLYSSIQGGFGRSDRQIQFRIMLPGLALLRRVILLGDHPENAIVRVVIGCRVVLDQCPGDLLYDWGPVVFEHVLEVGNNVDVDIDQGPRRHHYDVILLGDFFRDNSAPWATHYQGLPCP